MMKQIYVLKLFLFFAARASEIGDNLLNDDTYCEGIGWAGYRDEKCFKLIKKWATRDEAKDICDNEAEESGSYTSQLVTIKSYQEQSYLTEYVFNTSAVTINVWLGAKREEDNLNKFVWDDGSDVDFTNWVEGSPTENAKRNCVEMQSNLSRKPGTTEINLDKVEGRWRDVSCDQPNYVVCEKLPKWSLSKVQQTLLGQRKELNSVKSQLDGTQRDLSDTKKSLSVAENQIEDIKNQLVNTQSELSQTKFHLATLQSNPVPIGFIYVQLPSQSEPKTLWPTVDWKDVTLEYEGLFFRAEGGGAAQFGTIQPENAPRVDQVRLVYYHISVGTNSWRETNLNAGDWGSGIGVYSGPNVCCGEHAHTHQFHTTGGEVRPRNMAMRLWKRIN